VRDKTRLIVGAALSVSPWDWDQPERENVLLFSSDAVTRDILVCHRPARGDDSRLRGFYPRFT